jgi:hypothetical protein
MRPGAATATGAKARVKGWSELLDRAVLDPAAVRARPWYGPDEPLPEAPGGPALEGVSVDAVIRRK